MVPMNNSYFMGNRRRFLLNDLGTQVQMTLNGSYYHGIVYTKIYGTRTKDIYKAVHLITVTCGTSKEGPQ